MLKSLIPAKESDLMNHPRFFRPSRRACRIPGRTVGSCETAKKESSWGSREYIVVVCRSRCDPVA